MVTKKTIITIGSIFLVSIFSISIFLPIFLNYSHKSEMKQEQTINIKKYFNDKKINQDISTKISIIDKIEKHKIIEKLTNFHNICSVNKLKYSKDNVETHLKDIIKDQVIKESNININNLYLQVRYNILDENQLQIDARWIDKTNHLLLYYDKNMIKLNKK